jgi:hypothetical protein
VFPQEPPHGACFRGGGGGNRLSAYASSIRASSPGYQCAVAAAHPVSEALTLGRPRRCSPATWAAGAGGRRQRACGPLLSRPLPASQGCATALWFSRSALHRASGAWRWRSVRAYSRCWGPRRAGARFCFRGSRASHAPVASRCRMRCLWCTVASLSCHAARPGAKASAAPPGGGRHRRVARGPPPTTPLGGCPPQVPTTAREAKKRPRAAPGCPHQIT